MAASTKPETKELRFGKFAAKPLDKSGKSLDGMSFGSDFIANAVRRCDYVMQVDVAVPGMPDFSVPITGLFSVTKKENRITSLAFTLFAPLFEITNFRIFPRGEEDFTVSFAGRNLEAGQANATLQATMPEGEVNGDFREERVVFAGRFNAMAIGKALYKAFVNSEYAVLDHEAMGTTRETPEEQAARFQSWQEAQNKAKNAAEAENKEDKSEASDESDSGVTVE